MDFLLFWRSNLFPSSLKLLMNNVWFFCRSVKRYRWMQSYRRRFECIKSYNSFSYENVIQSLFFFYSLVLHTVSYHFTLMFKLYSFITCVTLDLVDSCSHNIQTKLLKITHIHFMKFSSEFQKRVKYIWCLTELFSLWFDFFFLYYGRTFVYCLTMCFVLFIFFCSCVNVMMVAR